MNKDQKSSGGSKKHGRSKRVKDTALSNFVRNRITFEQYARQKGIKFKS